MIRPATVADAPDIARVQVETWRLAYDALLPADYLALLSVAAGTVRWEEHLAGADRRTFVAGEPVRGFAAAGPPRDPDLPDRTGEVYAVYVHPARQRQGLGRALVDAAVDWLAGCGYAAAALWVLTGNAAGRAFYEHGGWQQDGSERTIDIGGALADEVRYRRDISGTGRNHLAGRALT